MTRILLTIVFVSLVAAGLYGLFRLIRDIGGANRHQAPPGDALARFGGTGLFVVGGLLALAVLLEAAASDGLSGLSGMVLVLALLLAALGFTMTVGGAAWLAVLASRLAPRDWLLRRSGQDVETFAWAAGAFPESCEPRDGGIFNARTGLWASGRHGRLRTPDGAVQTLSQWERALLLRLERELAETLRTNRARTLAEQQMDAYTGRAPGAADRPAPPG